jgi:hypothetical protein
MRNAFKIVVGKYEKKGGALEEFRAL